MSVEAVKRDEVFTLPSVVGFMLDDVGFVPEVPLSGYSILEPCAGDGAFLVEIIHRLRASCHVHNQNFDNALKSVYAVEIKDHNIDDLLNRLKQRCELTVAQISSINIIKGDYLTAKLPKFDFIIGNPPYVRWDHLDLSVKQQLSKNFTTFRGRCDLYIAFYEKALSELKPEGLLSFICSNRWFKSAYGKHLRTLIAKRYWLKAVIDMESTNPFTSNALAYPAITKISGRQSNGKTNHIVIDDLNLLNEPLCYQQIEIRSFINKVWSFDSSYNQLLDSKYYTKIETIGYKVNIGIATGKDDVFIGDDLQNHVEKELLVPVVKGQHLKTKVAPKDLYVIDVFDRNGDLLDLEQYPKLKKYLEKHKSELSKRHIAKKSSSKWYRTIDKIKKENIFIDKILLPDITGTKEICLGGKGKYPHHNVYYITKNSSTIGLDVLAGILSTDFVASQLGVVGNKMNGGYPRWQAQNIRRLVIPDARKLSTDWLVAMSQAYNDKDYGKMNTLVLESNIINNYQDIDQMVMFDSASEYN